MTIYSADTLKRRKRTLSVNISYAYLYVFRSRSNVRLEHVAQARSFVDLSEARFCTYLKVSRSFVHSVFVHVPQTL